MGIFQFFDAETEKGAGDGAKTNKLSLRGYPSSKGECFLPGKGWGKKFGGESKVGSRFGQRREHEELRKKFATGSAK